jgi:hypothetical protein
VKLYDTASWKVAQAFDWDMGRLRSVAFSPDGMLGSAGNDKGKIVVWDVDPAPMGSLPADGKLPALLAGTASGPPNRSFIIHPPSRCLLLARARMKEEKGPGGSMAKSDNLSLFDFPWPTASQWSRQPRREGDNWSLLAIPLALPFDVVLNGYNLSRLTDVEGLLPDVRARGGALLRFDVDGLAEVRR